SHSLPNLCLFSFLIPRPPCSTLFPYTTLFRSRRRGSPRARPRPARSGRRRDPTRVQLVDGARAGERERDVRLRGEVADHLFDARDRKSTRLNSSHVAISYAVFCLKKKKKKKNT